MIPFVHQQIMLLLTQPRTTSPLLCIKRGRTKNKTIQSNTQPFLSFRPLSFAISGIVFVFRLMIRCTIVFPFVSIAFSFSSYYHYHNSYVHIQRQQTFPFLIKTNQKATVRYLLQKMWTRQCFDKLLTKQKLRTATKLYVDAYDDHRNDRIFRNENTESEVPPRNSVKTEMKQKKEKRRKQNKYEQFSKTTAKTSSLYLNRSSTISFLDPLDRLIEESKRMNEAIVEEQNDIQKRELFKKDEWKHSILEKQAEAAAAAVTNSNQKNNNSLFPDTKTINVCHNVLSIDYC